MVAKMPVILNLHMLVQLFLHQIVQYEADKLMENDNDFSLLVFDVHVSGI